VEGSCHGCLPTTPQEGAFADAGRYGFFCGVVQEGESQVRDTEMSGEMSGLKSAKIYL